MIASAGLARPGQTLIAGKGYRSAQFEARLAQAGITVIRPATKKEPSRPGARFPRPLRQIIESVNNTPKTQLSLERHRGRTRAGVAVRILTRILAPTPPSGTTRPHTNPAQHAHSPPTTTNPLELTI